LSTYVQEAEEVTLPENLDELMKRRDVKLRALGEDGPHGLSNGFSFRFAWPNKTKGGLFTLNGFFQIKPFWQVYASASEALVLGDAVAGSFVGNARFTVQSVTPGDNQMRVAVKIENFDGQPWGGGPLSLMTDFLVIPT
jgi:hypothetical protein